MFYGTQGGGEDDHTKTTDDTTTEYGESVVIPLVETRERRIWRQAGERMQRRKNEWQGRKREGIRRARIRREYEQ